jgi:hypothetical protein
MDSSNERQQPALDPAAPNFAPAQPSSTGNFRLPDFWPDQPENWFAMAEAQFCLRRVAFNVDKYCHLLLALPKASYRLVSHLVTQVPKDDSYENVKAVLLSHHVLSDYQRVELMSKMEPMGARKPSDLLAAMMEQTRTSSAYRWRLRLEWTTSGPAPYSPPPPPKIFILRPQPRSPAPAPRRARLLTCTEP